MRSPLLRQLKQETLSQHESLEQKMQLLRPEMTLAEYRLVLEGFYGFYSPWEQSAAPVLNRLLPGFFDERFKTPLLEKDLRWLDSDYPAIRKCSCLPATTCLLRLLGSLYVLEGATLGGQILSRHFTKQFDLSSQEGCSFFAGYGAATGSRWKEFCELLNSYSSPENDRIIVESAVQTFDYLGMWLQQRNAFLC